MLDRSALRGAFSFPGAGVLWLAGLLLLLSWMVPLHVLPWMSWHNEVIAGSAVLAGGLFALRGRAVPYRVTVPSVSALPLLLALLALAQFLEGRIAYAGSVWTVFSYAAIATAAAAAGSAAGQFIAPRASNGAHPSADVLAFVVLLGAMLQVLVVFGQTLGLWPEAEWVARIAYETRGGGNLAQPNHAGLLFVMGIAAALYLRQTGRIPVVLVAMLLLLLCAGLATVQSRGAMLGLFVMLGWHLLRPRDQARSPREAWLLALAAIAVVFFVAWPSLAAAYWMLGDVGGVNVTTSGRTAMWSQLLRAIVLRPWFGWGVMQVAEAQDAVAHGYQAVMSATFSHNVLLDLALWVGLPAFALCVWMTVSWLRTRLPSARTAASAFCVAMVLPLAVQSLTEFPYAYAYFIVPAFFALGLLDAWTGSRRAIRVPRRTAAAVLGAGLVLHVWAAVEYTRIEEDFRVARFEALNMGTTPAGYEAPQVVILTQLGALLRATRVEPRPGMTPEEMELLESVAMLYPWGAPNFQYIVALALNDRVAEANRQLKSLRARHGPRIHDSVVARLEEMSVEHPALKQLSLR